MKRQVTINAGIGDNLIALTAVCGLKMKYPQDHIIFASNYVAWMKLFEGYDELVHKAVEGIVTYHPYDSYKLELAIDQGKRTRAELYCSFVDGVAPALPPHKPLPPSNHPGAIVLSPFTHWNSRQWNVFNWIALEKLLHQEGYQTVILDEKKDRTARFKGVKLQGQPPEQVASTVKDALCLIGNDSGMAHLAGALGTKAVVVSAATKGESVFGVWPAVKVVTGRLPCSGCYWRGPHYLPEFCNASCASLNTITPQMVLEAL